ENSKQIKISDIINNSKLFQNLDEQKQTKVKEICNCIIPNLDEIAKFFPEYTPHGLQHIINVLNDLEELLNPIIDKLDQDQSLCLLLGAICHDIGMASITSNEFESYKLTDSEREQIRQTHHERAEKFILSTPILKDLTDAQRIAIARIVKGHRKVNLYSTEYRDFRIKNLDFLAAALRLADELEITKHRINFLDIFTDKEKFLGKTEKSQTYWEGHLALESWKLSDNREVLQIYGTIETDTGHRAVELVQKSIEKTLREVRDIQFQGEYVLPLKEDFNLTFKGLASEKYRIEMETQSIITYLFEHLYTEELVAIREVVQNAIDGCQLRGQRTSKYEPQVIVEVVDNKIIVTDNGRGMNLDIIQKYLIVLGRPYYRSKDFEIYLEYADYEPDVIGRFGIGIFSVFLLADTFRIRTRYKPKEPVESKWHETRFTRTFCPTYTIKKPPGTFEFGTQVIIELRESCQKTIKEEMLAYLHKTFIRPKVPIVYKNGSKEEKIGLFPIGTTFGTLEKPTISLTEDHFQIYAQNSEGVFWGYKIERGSEKSRLLQSSRFEVVPSQTLICSEGITVTTQMHKTEKESLYLQLIRDLVPDVLRKNVDLQTKLVEDTIVDVPSKYCTLTIDRGRLRDKTAKVIKTCEDIEKMLEKGVLFLKQDSRIGDKFWDIYLEKYYKKTLKRDVFNPHEGIDSCRVILGGGRVVRIRDVPDEQKSVSLESLLGNVLINGRYGDLKERTLIEEKFLKPIDLFFLQTPAYIIGYILNSLKKRDWKITYLTVEKLETILSLFDGEITDHSLGFILEFIDFHPTEQEELVKAILPRYLRKSTNPTAKIFSYDWFETNIVKNNWVSILNLAVNLFQAIKGIDIDILAFEPIKQASEKLGRRDIVESLGHKIKQWRKERYDRYGF
ncbi:MAG: hypothetical protein ACFFBD_05815, partial [Candidatus Hodarchaeota archaeon]